MRGACRLRCSRDRILSSMRTGFDILAPLYDVLVPLPREDLHARDLRLKQENRILDLGGGPGDSHPHCSRTPRRSSSATSPAPCCAGPHAGD